MTYIKQMLTNPAHWRKFWISLTAPLGALLLAMAATDTQPAFEVTRNEWYVVLVSLAASVGVERVRNK